MGCSAASYEDDKWGASKEDTHRDARINMAIRQDSEHESKSIRILLLGASECGKTTILKQMKILHRNGFSKEERAKFRHVVRANTIESIQQLIRACSELKIEFDSKDRAHADTAMALRSAASTAESSQAVARAIRSLWTRSNAVRLAVARRHEFYMYDSAGYFLDRSTRIFEKNYTPSNQDILRARSPTVGITEFNFALEGAHFRMFDVGGQRGERKKWIQCFEDVRALMFVTSLSEYDQMLLEDPTRNRMVESVTLFSGLIGLPWFKKTPILLFFNKADVFESKIQTVDPGKFFEDYYGGCDAKKALDFIRRAYLSCNQAGTTIYPHVTTATNTENIGFVWLACRRIILGESLAATGISNPDFSGTWKLTKSENLDGFLKAKGVGWIKRKMAAGMGVTQIIEQKGNALTVKISATIGSVVSKMEIGDKKGAVVTALNGEKSDGVVAWEADGKTLKMVLSSGGKVKAEEYRTLENGTTMRLRICKMDEPKAEMVRIFTKTG